MSYRLTTRPDPEPDVRKPQQLAILALTGGGMRGLFTARILEELQVIRNAHTIDTDKHLHKAFDAVAGTSVGSLLAAGLVLEKDPGDIADIFTKYGSTIFPAYKRPKLFKGRKAWYDNGPLHDVVCELIDDDIRLGNLPNNIVIPTFNESTGEPVVFSNLNTVHSNKKLIDVVMASAAAPIYFPA
ncbi:MAG: patatin-like phospholipase family protein, partial [Rhodospirillales bacterium]|nr:patatin-like phospholipase family protein [Rhodospirillales bacterium]